MAFAARCCQVERQTEHIRNLYKELRNLRSHVCATHGTMMPAAPAAPAEQTEKVQVHGTYGSQEERQEQSALKKMKGKKTRTDPVSSAMAKFASADLTLEDRKRWAASLGIAIRIIIH